jgi:hypothetical protein
MHSDCSLSHGSAYGLASPCLPMPPPEPSLTFCAPSPPPLLHELVDGIQRIYGGLNPTDILMVDGIQRIYGGWNPSGEKVTTASQSKPNIVRARPLSTLLHLEPTHLFYYTGYTWSPLTSSTTLATLGAHSPPLLHWLHWEPTPSLYYTLAALGAHSPPLLHWLHFEPTHLLYYTGCTSSPLTSSTTLAALGAHSLTILHSGCAWSR